VEAKQKEKKNKKMVTYHRGVSGKENSVESCRAGSFVLLVGGQSICKWIKVGHARTILVIN
jgi:hypothetical protein